MASRPIWPRRSNARPPIVNGNTVPSVFTYAIRPAGEMEGLGQASGVHLETIIDDKQLDY